MNQDSLDPERGRNFRTMLAACAAERGENVF